MTEKEVCELIIAQGGCVACHDFSCRDCPFQDIDCDNDVELAKQWLQDNGAGMHITVWRFEDAPSLYKELSTRGGDEDWVAFVPQHIYDKYYIGWLDEGNSPGFGCCSIDHFPVEGGVVAIGAHA